MHAYSQVLLAELNLHSTFRSLTTSRHAAERYAQLEAVRGVTNPSEPTTQPALVRRLLALVRATA